MAIDPQVLFDKIMALPEDRRAEVADFVEAVTDEKRRNEALTRLLAIAPALEAARIARPSEDEILAEVKAVRREMREERASRS